MPIEIPYKLGTNGLYYYGNTQIAKADVASFRILNRIWACDQKTVYAYGRPLKKADRATFTVLNQLFAKDSQFVFAPDGILKGADPASFEVLDDGYCEFEERNSFGDIVTHDFEHSSYARDRALVYLHVYTFKTRVLKNVDRNTFEVLKHGYGRDACRVYYEGVQVKKANPKTFEQIGRRWGRDDRRVFYFNDVIEGADRDSFALVDEHDNLARDRKQFFYQRMVAPPDRIAFDKNNQPMGRPLVDGLRLGIAKLTQFLDAGADPRREPLALALACQYHDVAMVQLLLDHGANGNWVDPSGNIPILATACWNREPMPIVKLLLDAGADVNGGGGMPPLQTALMAGKYELAEYLVSRGADVNVKANSGQSLLEYAKWLATPPQRVIEFLQARGAR